MSPPNLSHRTLSLLLIASIVPVCVVETDRLMADAMMDRALEKGQCPVRSYRALNRTDFSTATAAEPIGPSGKVVEGNLADFKRPQ